MPVLGRLADLQPVSRGGYTPYQPIGLDCHELRVSRKPQESCLTPTQTPSCLGAHTQISHETQHLLSHYKPAVHTLDHTVSGNTRGAGGTGVVDVGTQLVSGDGVPPPPPNLHGDDRRIPPGVGGGHLEEAQALGQWSLLESEAHVNLLDRLAVLGTLQAFAQRLTGRRVRIQTDNSTVVAYLNSQGGTHSRVLCRHTGTLLQWCFDRSNVSDCSPYRS